MSQLDYYEHEIAVCVERLQKAKDDLAFLRLQAKQTRASAALAKRDPLIKAFIKAMPKDHVEVMPSPGCVYVSVQLSLLQASLYADVPKRLGLECIGSEKVGDGLAAPTIWKYRGSPGVLFYITKHVR